MRACVKETMRVMPILACNFRDTGKDQVIGGYQVPEGVSSACQPYRVIDETDQPNFAPLFPQTVTAMANVLTQVDEKNFPKAEQFIPERWLTGGAAEHKANHPFAFLPFGFGPRMCVGKRFANLELENLIAKVSSGGHVQSCCFPL